jgi:predicted outer membrane lipoprotein
VNPVSRRDLVALALALAVAGWLVVRAAYGDLPALRWWLPVPVGLLALAEAGAARTLGTRLRAQRDRRPIPGGGPVEPLLVARLVVLAQASAYVGAVLAGCWAGVLLHTVPALDRLTAARGDTGTAVLGVLLAVALTVAALWLEHVAEIPLDDDDRPTGARA